MHGSDTPPHILCINHAPEILELLRTLLESEGYRVSTQSTTERNLDRIAQLAPDLITIDYMWSSSDDEWTHLNLLTIDPRTRDIPVILCTGAIAEAMEIEGHLSAIGVRVVYKPFDIDALLDAVRDLLQPTSGGDQEPGTESTPPDR